ncbi:hypothetical protein BgiBS90_006839 [Biomphalaria glabrata]|nr:hypothetical protein BgiBS90_006839 [Biomphalaria glabrata]
MNSSSLLGDVLRYPIISLILGGCFYVLRNSKETWLRFQESRRHRVIIVCVSVVAAVIQLTSVLRCIAFLVYVGPNFDNLISFFLQAYLYILYGSVVALVEVVIRELYDIRTEMKRIMSLVSGEMEQNFKQVRSRHQSLCHIVTKLSQLTRLNGSVGLFFNVGIMFLALYSLGREQLSKMFILMELFCIAWTMLYILIICFIWGRLSSAAHSIVDSIGLSCISGVSQDLMQQLQLLVVCCSSKRIGIDVFGLFTLDSHTFLMVMGTIVTYGIVVIQFQQDKSMCTLNVSSTTLL